MSKNFSRRGVLMAAGGATAAVVAATGNKAFGQQRGNDNNSLGILREGHLSHEDLDASHYFSVYVRNDSRRPKRRLAVLLTDNNGRHSTLDLGSLGAASPPAQGPSLYYSLSNLTIVKAQFIWKEGLIGWHEFPPNPAVAANGNYIYYAYVVWDAQNNPDGDFFEAQI